MANMDINEILEENRIIFIAEEITQELVSALTAKMLYFETLNPTKDITIYLNCPGGDTEAMSALIDVMNYVKPDISVVNISRAYSAASLILACGTKGKRYMLPSAKVMIHSPSLITTKNHWSCTDIQETYDAMNKVKEQYIETMLKHSNITEAQLNEFLEKDTYLSVLECIELGIVDHILKVK